MLICDNCESPATSAFDREGQAVPVGSNQDEQRFCEECLLHILEKQGGALAGCD